MALAYDYPLLGIFWSIFVFYVFLVWVMALFFVIAHIFRSRDLGGLSKAIWLIFVIALPILGLLVYVVLRGDKMVESAVAAAEARDAALDGDVTPAAGTAAG